MSRQVGKAETESRPKPRLCGAWQPTIWRDLAEPDLTESEFLRGRECSSPALGTPTFKICI